MQSQIGHAATHQITGNRHHIGTQGIHALHDAAEISAPDRRADVDIGYLRHGKAVQGLRQPSDRHVHRTTLAVRLALQKPQPVAASASSGTATALYTCKLSSDTSSIPFSDHNQASSQASSRNPSRSKVSTNSDENKPINNRPNHKATTSSTGLSGRRPSVKAVGIHTADNSNKPANNQPLAGQPVSAASAGTIRQPIQACNRKLTRVIGNNGMRGI